MKFDLGVLYFAFNLLLQFSMPEPSGRLQHLVQLYLNGFWSSNTNLTVSVAMVLFQQIRVSRYKKKKRATRQFLFLNNTMLPSPFVSGVCEVWMRTEDDREPSKKYIISKRRRCYVSRYSGYLIGTSDN